MTNQTLKTPPLFPVTDQEREWLREAREQIDAGYEEYICLVIVDAECERDIRKTQLGDKILATIGHNATVLTWLRDVEGSTNPDQDPRQTRLAWIDALLAQEEA